MKRYVLLVLAASLAFNVIHRWAKPEHSTPGPY